MRVTTNDTTLPGFFPATAMPDSDWWEALWPEPQQVLAALEIRPHMEVVDLCCGDGLFTAPLALMSRRVTAIDIDPGMLALARAKVAGTGATNCDFIEGDAYAVAELVRRPVDFVLIANTFHGVPDKTRLARSVAAILKPDGRFAVVNWHRRPREETTVRGQSRGPKTEMRMTPDDVAAAVESAGLVLARIIELPPYHYGAVFQKPPHDRLRAMEITMDKQDEKTSKAKSPGAEGGPMAMGMAMAKKMMSQMGQGGSPMEMMQKMMAQMSQGESKPPMEKMMGMCMGMCSEMLAALKQTNALAVFGTPELRAGFTDWLKAYEDKALAVLTQGEQDAAGLASALQIGEESARYILCHLAASGKIILTGKVNT